MLEYEETEAGKELEKRIAAVAAAQVERRLRPRLRRDLIILATLLVALVVAGWIVVGQFTAAVSDASREGCERQNVVRQQIRHARTDEIAQLRKDRRQAKNSYKEYRDVFPNLTPARFQELIDKQVRRLNAEIGDKRRQRDAIPDAPCSALYP